MEKAKKFSEALDGDQARREEEDAAVAAKDLSDEEAEAVAGGLNWATGELRPTKK